MLYADCGYAGAPPQPVSMGVMTLNRDMHMANQLQEFNILFRRPIYPLIIIAQDGILMSAFNINELAACCLAAITSKEGDIIKAIDSTGEEFWYSPENCTIAPGFAFKKWTKRKIIDLYNSSLVMEDTTYPDKSLSNKRLDAIISDICKLLRS